MSVTFSVYSRRGCHLCELLLEELEPMMRGHGRIEVLDVDEQDDWTKRYGDRVPVVCVGDRQICEYHLDRLAVQREFGGVNPPRQV